MQLNELLPRLHGVKQNGKQYVARCPVSTHGKGNGDKNPSLSIGVKDNNILLKCHAGCSTESIVTALGLEMKDLFIEESPAGYVSGNSRPKREIATVYDYKDLNGNVIHSTIRYKPKGFSQRRPDPDKHGEYIWKEVFKGITSIIYNLEAVTTAIKEKQPILVVEGEKDCDNLAKYGFIGTTYSYAGERVAQVATAKTKPSILDGIRNFDSGKHSGVPGGTKSTERDI